MLCTVWEKQTACVSDPQMCRYWQVPLIHAFPWTLHSGASLCYILITRGTIIKARAKHLHETSGGIRSWTLVTLPGPGGWITIGETLLLSNGFHHEASWSLLLLAITMPMRADVQKRQVGSQTCSGGVLSLTMRSEGNLSEADAHFTMLKIKVFQASYPCYFPAPCASPFQVLAVKWLLLK